MSATRPPAPEPVAARPAPDPPMVAPPAPTRREVAVRITPDRAVARRTAKFGAEVENRGEARTDVWLRGTDASGTLDVSPVERSLTLVVGESRVVDVVVRGGRRPVW